MPSIILNTNSLSVPEGRTATFQVKLSSRPDGTVTVGVRRDSGDADISVASGASLTFNRYNYGVSQTVTLKAAADADATNGSARFKVSGEGMSSVYLTATEAEAGAATPPTMVLDKTSVQVPAGGTAAFTVKLSKAPASTVSVAVARSAGDTDVSVKSGTTLTFTTSNWSTPQTVTLAASATNANATASAVITLTGAGVTSNSLTATQVMSSPTQPAIVVSAANLTVPAGGQASFTVKLSAAPAAGVTVTAVRASGDTDISIVSGASLAFTTSNWGTAQTVTLAASATDANTAANAVIALSGAGLTGASVTASQSAPASTSQRVVIDPVSRIEGHLRIEVEVAGGKVSKAWSTVTLFRGVETILKGRDPRDAPLMTQRLCGVCTWVHGLTAVRAIESAASLTTPNNARIVRNLMTGAQFIHDHIVHFYHLHGMDWVDVTKALSADPAKTQALATSVSPTAKAFDFAAVKTRLQTFVNSGQLGPFANAYWGHSAYKLTPEENLLLFAHYLDALAFQTKVAKMHALFGGKNPHPQSMVPGGVTCGGELNATQIAAFRSLLAEAKTFAHTIYEPDVRLLASRYPEWAGFGGFKNFLAFGEFPLTASEPQSLFMPRGLILGGDVMGTQAVDAAKITEHVARSWYQGATDYHPSQGVTDPAYTDMNVEDRYSWSKAPRYNGQPMEVGPLARVLVGYGLGQTQIRAAVDAFLAAVGQPLAAMQSTLGRTAARMIETVVLADAMDGWLTTLQNNIAGGDKTVFKSYALPASSTGVGYNEAPRGALGHWLQVSGGKIANYQMVVPSTWNFGPRDLAGAAGPLEQALIGVPVADPANPVELLRVIHSFDPCIACGVHVIDVAKNEKREFKVL